MDDSFSFSLPYLRADTSVYQDFWWCRVSRVVWNLQVQDLDRLSLAIDPTSTPKIPIPKLHGPTVTTASVRLHTGVSGRHQSRAITLEEMDSNRELANCW